MRTLYVTDLDGTLLNTKDRINLESLTLAMSVIVYNGAFIMRPDTKEINIILDIIRR